MGVSIRNRVGQVQVLRNGKGKGKREGMGVVARGNGSGKTMSATISDYMDC